MHTRSGIQARLLDAISSCGNEILDFTKALVAVPTENPPGNLYRRCVSIIEAKLKEMGLGSEVLEVSERGAQFPASANPGADSGRAYCLRSFYGTGPRVLYFHGHYDVVPASSPAQFMPVVKSDNLFGRGSADMKGGLAAMIYAVKAIQACGLKLNGRIGLSIVPDEETGGARGSRHLAGLGLLGKDGIGMLTPEPTGGVVWNACRGAISLRVQVRGKPAHVGLHYRGINAFEKMLAVAGALMELKSEVELSRTAFKIQPDAARSSILLIGGQCEGGTNFNTVPADCSFTVDRRINPEEDLEVEKKKLTALFEKLRRDGMELETEILQEGRSAGFSEDDPLARALAKSVESMTGKAPAFEMCPGLLEIRFYADEGVPALAYGPGLLSVSHGPNEFVSLSEVHNCAAVYALMAVELLG